MTRLPLLTIDDAQEAAKELLVPAEKRNGFLPIKKPLTTFGNVKADVLALMDMNYVRQNFCSIILGAAWPN
jgi:hypothetical protein